MKKLGFLIVLLAVVVSCKKEVPVDYAIISGKIINKKGNNLTIINKDRSFKQDISVNENGSFIDTLRVKPNGDGYILFQGKQGKNSVRLFVENGNNIKVNFDTKNLDSTLVISGKGAEISNYLLAKIKKINELLGNGAVIYTKEEGEYKAKRLEIKNSLETLLKATSGISEEYKAKEIRNINYNFILTLNIYEAYHKHYTKKKEFKVSKEFLADIEQVTDFNNEEDFNFSQNYNTIVFNHYKKESEKIMKNDSLDKDLAFLTAINKSPNGVIKNQLLFEAAKSGITYTDDLESYYQLYMKNSSNEDQKAEVTKSYTRLKSVTKGQPSPKFIDCENYNGGTTSLDDLKGKYVYIDVWATWCGPCKIEIPALKELEKKYHGKNIQFVSISVDDAKGHDAWKKMIAKKGMKGIQLFANKNFKSDFAQVYGINSIPRFILIDDKGNIINPNAKRPSDPKLVDVINSLDI